MFSQSFGIVTGQSVRNLYISDFQVKNNSLPETLLIQPVIIDLPLIVFQENTAATITVKGFTIENS